MPLPFFAGLSHHLSFSHLLQPDQPAAMCTLCSSHLTDLSFMPAALLPHLIILFCHSTHPSPWYISCLNYRPLTSRGTMGSVVSMVGSSLSPLLPWLTCPSTIGVTFYFKWEEGSSPLR